MKIATNIDEFSRNSAPINEFRLFDYGKYRTDRIGDEVKHRIGYEKKARRAMIRLDVKNTRRFLSGTFRESETSNYSERKMQITIILAADEK